MTPELFLFLSSPSSSQTLSMVRPQALLIIAPGFLYLIDSEPEMFQSLEVVRSFEILSPFIFNYKTQEQGLTLYSVDRVLA